MIMKKEIIELLEIRRGLIIYLKKLARIGEFKKKLDFI